MGFKMTYSVDKIVRTIDNLKITSCFPRLYRRRMTTETPSLKLQRVVQERLSRGGYATEEELLLAALEALDWRDRLDDSIQAGLDDMAAGRVQPIKGLADRIRERVKLRHGP
jgi:hypothetical protein